MTAIALYGERKSGLPDSHLSGIRGLTGAILFCAAFHTAHLIAAPEKEPPTEQQLLFWEAKQALQQGNDARFGRYVAQLHDYPLYPYLIYWRLQRRLSHELPLTIEAYLNQYGDLPIASQLRDNWLYKLAKQRRWEDYLRFYQPTDNDVLRCYFHYAQYKTGDVKAAWAGAKSLWLVGYSQDDACNPLFNAWQKAGGITNKLLLKRIELVMLNRDAALANHLARPLHPAQLHALTLWQLAYDNPSLLFSKTLREDNEFNRTIIFRTLQYRAKRSPRSTMAQWKKLESKYAFTPDQHTAITRAIAFGLGYTNNVLALDWFLRLPDSERDMEVCDLALRVALRHQRWGDALAWIEVMPDSQNHSTRAVYWRGRILEEMGFAETARYYFKRIRKTRSYYGFLAADRLNMPYNLDDKPLQVSDALMDHVSKRPDMQRATELYRLGLIGSARREWKHATARMNHTEMLAASKLADELGWKERALFTLADADHFDDLTIRFPLSFYETVQKEAKRRSLDPAWVYAVVRQESAMMPNVQSPVGALGLMQVMPKTGRAIARELQLSLPDRHQLLKPETNIRFGSYYLRQVLREFNQNPVLATAAYNAGPHRIRKWYPKQGSMAADIWVDTIPFDETRDYVRRVMTYAVFYDHRLELPVKRLWERMPPVNTKHKLGHCGECGQTSVLAQAEPSGTH